MPGWGPALPQSAFRGAVAVLISLLLILSGGGVTAAAYGDDDREEGSSSLEFTPSDECVTAALPLAGSAVREGHHPRRRALPPARPDDPAGSPRTSPTVSRADTAPACAARAGHTVLRC
ncbi:hypothetical protein [Streptomyces sp. NPDC002537]